MLRSNIQADEPGGALLVMKGSEVVFSDGYGIANLATGEEIGPNTVFNTGSISKTFVANGILILTEQGDVSLDDPLTKYFNDFDHPEVIADIQLAHLLSHTSGLPDLRNVAQNREKYLTGKDKENFEPLKAVRRLNFPPGERFQYSNPAYNGLALILEHQSGMKWQDFIRQKIFIPSDMRSSTITDGAHPAEGVAHAYELIDGQYQERDYGEVPTFAAAGNGGVWSSVMELAKYEIALRESRFLGHDLINESRTLFRPTNWEGDNNPFVGYGWFIGASSLLEGDELDVELIYHTGSQGGFRAFHITIPEKNLVFIGLFNRPLPLRTLIRKGLKILEQNHWLE